MVVNLIALTFGFVCGVASTVRMYNRNEEIKKRVKEEIDRLHEAQEV